MDKNFIVYEHYTIDTNELFYIGEGRPERAKDKKGRNKYWNFKVNKHNGFKIKIIHSNISKEEAINIEKELIFKYRNEGINLTNICESTFTGGKHWLVGKPKEMHPMYGKKNPNPTLAKWNKEHFGDKSPVYGLKRPDLVERNKLANFKRVTRKVICVELNKEFESLTEAKLFLGGNPNLNRALKNGSLAKGYHWKYSTEVVI